MLQSKVGFRRSPLCDKRFVALSLNNLWSYEEDQLIGLGFDRALLEQVAEPRNVTQNRRLRGADRIRRLDHSTDHHRATIGDQYLSGRLLGCKDGITVNGTAGLSILNIHGEKNSVVRSNLRRYGKPQNRVNEGNAGV